MKVIPIEVRVQSMVCELLEDTKARLEEIVEWLTEEAKKDRAQMEEERKSEYGNPVMYQGFIDSHLELIAHHQKGIVSIDSFIIQAKELEQKLANFWEEQDKARDERKRRQDR